MPRRKRDNPDGYDVTITEPGGTITELKGIVDELERLANEKLSIQAAITEVLAEAEDRGFHKKALRESVRRRMETADQRAVREAFEDSLDDMLSRLGMLRDTPLGQAAAEAAQERVRH